MENPLVKLRFEIVKEDGEHIIQEINNVSILSRNIFHSTASTLLNRLENDMCFNESEIEKIEREMEETHWKINILRKRLLDLRPELEATCDLAT